MFRALGFRLRLYILKMRGSLFWEGAHRWRADSETKNADSETKNARSETKKHGFRNRITQIRKQKNMDSELKAQIRKLVRADSETTTRDSETTVRSELYTGTGLRKVEVEQDCGKWNGPRVWKARTCGLGNQEVDNQRADSQKLVRAAKSGEIVVES